MAGDRKKCKKCPPEGAPDYMLTYGDMVTLLLTFFVMLLTTATIDGHQLRLILAAFPGLGSLEGGNTLEAGPLAELGNTIESLPSMERGRALSEARREAISIFQPEIQSEMVRVQEDERGLVISLAGDSFFETASARVRIEQTRGILQRLSRLLSLEILSERTFRIEGHTDNIATDPNGPWPSNWELSTERALAVLRYLAEFGVEESQFQVMGLGEHRPLYDNTTAEGRAYNRRVDVIILTDGHL
ncbi:chemotaxis protein MotB [Alkalispirochaeta americana]|uniref:Chemotaxis protein MotB n=1 Tax=Alkalispirochaeta americana TaxID=159291 RepID=A0A1N6PLT8_9SPIO|nr:flagellar motor protein MotB [Alkalispirochaeta americana]SIQ05344.1 chemotaxis protein MotB [Alkalispirochaeta americana]